MPVDQKSFLSQCLIKAVTKDGKTFIEKTVYEDVAMWWFVDSDFYVFIDLLIQSAGQIESCNFSFQKKNAKKYSTGTRKNFVYKSVFAYDIFHFFSSLLSRFIINFYGKHVFSDRNKILLTDENIEWRKMKNLYTNKIKKTDLFFDSILSLLVKNGKNEIVGIYPLCYPVSGIRVAIDKRINQKELIHKPLNAYWNLDTRKKTRKAKDHFLKVWDDLKSDEVFKNSLVCNKVSLFELFEEELSYYFTVVFYRMVGYLEMIKKMLEKEKPDLILIKEEYGQFERALIVEGKKRGIPTIGIQHGIPYPDIGYGIRGGRLSYLNKKAVSIDYPPIPDKTAVYGPSQKKFLVDVNFYPESSIFVTGQPRYDILCHASRLYSREKIFDKYKIDSNKKIILWLTQCHALTDSENYYNFNSVFEIIHSLKDVNLIIKQHPNEPQKYSKMLKKIVINYNINITIAPKDSDTYELLFVCDLAITKNSTVAVEAVILNKPLILINFGKEIDNNNYVNEGIAIGVYKKEDFLPAVEKLLKGDAELNKNRQKFIEKFLFKNDGKSTERVVDLIYKTIKENK